jgi:hypothetical protein
MVVGRGCPPVYGNCRLEAVAKATDLAGSQSEYAVPCNEQDALNYLATAPSSVSHFPGDSRPNRWSPNLALSSGLSSARVNRSSFVRW